MIGDLAGRGRDAVPVVMSTEAWERYDVPYAPYFVYVSGPAGRVVGEGVAAALGGSPDARRQRRGRRHHRRGPARRGGRSTPLTGRSGS